MDKKYYKEINNLSMRVDMLYQFGIAVFNYDRKGNYGYLKTFGKFNPNIDWYDCCLVNLGYKWIEELVWK